MPINEFSSNLILYSFIHRLLMVTEGFEDSELSTSSLLLLIPLSSVKILLLLNQSFTSALEACKLTFNTVGQIWVNSRL
jgi:hypothetical protein